MKTVTSSELKEMLKAGTVKFQFKKKNGQVRTAVGTLHSDLITKKTHGGVCIPKEAGYSVYFDVEKGDFRCYDDHKLIGVVEE